MRVHRFRHIAREALHATRRPTTRAELEAYAAGVNAGLAALAAPPFEYLVLRATPEPWRPEDSMLTAIAMYVTLQGAQWEYENTLGAMHDVLPEPLFEFLAGRASDWESPIVGEPYPVPPIPGPEVFDLRGGTRRGPRHGIGAGQDLAARRRPDPRPRRRAALVGAAAARGGSHARQQQLGGVGRAVDDRQRHRRQRHAPAAVGAQHLVSAPPTSIPDERRPGATRRLVGVTLPGGPQMAVGSNGDIAWGFTNSVGDWSDLVVDRPGARRPDAVPDARTGRAPSTSTSESIAVKGGGPGARVEVRWTIWGPVVGTGPRPTGELALKWVAHDPRVLATDAARIAEARDVDEAMRLSVGRGAGRREPGGRRSRRPDRLDDLRRHPAARRLPRRRARPRGPTARVAGTATSASTSTRASSIRPTAGCGRPTPAWSAARCSRRSATAATATASAPG